MPDSPPKQNDAGNVIFGGDHALTPEVENYNIPIEELFILQVKFVNCFFEFEFLYFLFCYKFSCKL